MTFLLFSKLTVDEIAQHTHNIVTSSSSLSGNIYDNFAPEYDNRRADGIINVSKYGSSHVSAEGGKQGNGHTFINASHSHSGNISNTGGNSPHENRSPYTVVQMWKRTV